MYRVELTETMLVQGLLRLMLAVVVSTAVPSRAEEVIVSTPSGTRHVMVLVPAGEFGMGRTASIRVTLDAYYIDKYEVTNAQYAAYAAATGRAAAPSAGSPDFGETDHPVVSVTWYESSAYCQWAGLRLPTEAEWEKAARGTDGREYPWGNEPPTFDLVNTGTRICGTGLTSACSPEGDDRDGYLFTAPVDSFAGGVSPYGAYNMSGNVMEFVSNWWSNSVSGGFNPTGPTSGPAKVSRGGWLSDIHNKLTTWRRFPSNPEMGIATGGFRCAQSASALPTVIRGVGWGEVKIDAGHGKGR